MANSKITIVYPDVPSDGEILNITESSLGLNLNEVFKKSRIGSYQTKIPSIPYQTYHMTILNSVDVTNVGARYANESGHPIDTPLIYIYHSDNGDGTSTYEIVSSVQVLIYDIPSGVTIYSWGPGHFDPVPGSGIYTGYVSSNYKTAFDLDYNTSSLFTVSTTNGAVNTGIGSVVVTANYSGAVFAVGTNTSGSVITIENETAVPEIQITEVDFSTATINQCQNVKVNVETDLLATKIISPVLVNPNTENPFSFDWLRGQAINVTVEDINGAQATQSVILPSILNASNFVIDVNNSPNGATIIIGNVNTSGLDLEYSLDNTTWQSSNTFSGLDAGDFDLYVRDQLGCSFSKPFTIDDFETDPNPSTGSNLPYSYISKSNSIRYANRITFGDSENYPNDENTLSYEAFAKDPKLAYPEVQQFQSADIITTQFKSNYETNIATIVKKDLSEIDVPVVKKTNNIGIKDKRDAIKYNLGSGKTGIYFNAGNTYNYDTNAVTGTYVLNGALPEWTQIGNYIQIGSAWFLIEEIVFDESKSADVIVFTNDYTGIDVSIIVGTIFNRFNYEVYEFTIDMVGYIDQYFNVRVNKTDPRFTEIIYLSELIWCKIKHEKVLEIKYRNSTNTDMFYATGITNLIRIPITYVKGKINEENETNKTDTTTILLSSELYEVDEFVFEPVTKEIWRKITQALSHETVTLNGVGYVKNGDFNTEGPLEDSNLYVLTATMIKTGSVYNSQTSGGSDFSGSEVEVPGLIQTDSGFVSYI